MPLSQHLPGVLRQQLPLLRLPLPERPRRGEAGGALRSSSRSGFSLAATSNRSACSGFFVEVVLTLHLQPELASPLKDHLGRHPSGPPSTVGFSDKLLDTTHGRNLATKVIAMARRLGFDADVTYSGTQFQLLDACFTKDVVVFDGSIEDEEHHIYHQAVMIPAACRHFLVVGVPIARSSGPGAGWYTGLSLSTLHARHRPAPLVVVGRRHSSLAPGATARFKNKGPRIKDLDFHATVRSNDLERINRMIQRFYTNSAPKTDPAGRLFFSYRSRCYDDALALVDRLHTGVLHGGVKKQVASSGPALLAYEKELLTAMRRWQLLALIDRIIADTEELIAFDACDYLASWWTQGELLTVAYRQLAGTSTPMHTPL